MFLTGREGPGVFQPGRDVGDDLSNLIDREIRRIVDDARSRAIELLEQNRPALETIAEELIENEVLEGEKLEKLLSDAKRAVRGEGDGPTGGGSPDDADKRDSQAAE